MPKRLAVIGGDAAGMTAAVQARRLDPNLEIVVLEKGDHTSYSACGIPYLVSGLIPECDDLVVRTPQEHRDRSRIDVRVRHEVMAIDLDARRLEVHDAGHGRTIQVPFDELLIATGARPLRPDLPGITLPMVRGVQTLDDAAALLRYAEESRCRNVVVVGGGYVGLEMAEAFVERGARVAVLDAGDHVMRTLDPDMATVVEDAMRKRGIDLRVGTRVEGFLDRVVRLESSTMPADLVVLGLGVVPNSELAREAGIAVGVRQAIAVDPRQRTSVSGVWAAGDCAESFHQVSRRPLHVALGTVANKHGRVAGTNIGGGYATFAGVIGTAVTKICSTEIGRTGLTCAEVEAAGLLAVSATIDSTTVAGYLPGAPPVRVKAVAERGTGRLLGMQIVGGPGSAKRIDIAATAITAGMTVDEVAELDLGYAPPFGPLWDPVAVAARKVSGLVRGF
jgi:NADPH-dependent 2,4-dienoyl-CoA reductase/sulfur reductase-like enzyme